MSDASTLKVSAIFDTDRNIMREIHRKVQENKELTQLLARYLDAALLEHCTIARYEQGILTLLVDNASWSTVLRYSAPTLQEELKKEALFSKLVEIQAKVAEPKPVPRVSPPPIPRALTSETQNILQNTAETVKNTKLRHALARFLKRS